MRLYDGMTFRSSSESCRVQDMIDPCIQHPAACIPTEPLESSLAITLGQRDYMRCFTRLFVKACWDKVRLSLHQAPETPRPLKELFVVSLNAKHLTKAVVYRLEKTR